MSISMSQAKKPILVWMAIATAILVAIHRIIIMLGGEEMAAIAGSGWFTPERTTNILVFWSLFLLLGAAYLWREANAIRGKWDAMERALADLELSYGKLKELEGWRDDLNHFVVHDIKHAVAGIDGSLQLLKRELGPALPAETGKFLTCAREFTEDLMTLVSTLLDIARLESAGMPLKKNFCDMGAIIPDAVNRMKTVADLKRLQVTVNVAPVTVFCDRELIGRVVVNLLANAIRFAPEGSPVLVSLMADEREVRFTVADQGPGVAPEMQARVFEKFAQGGVRAGGGVAGLGLTFCRLAVEAHGGCIGVESPVDPADQAHPGSRFWFTLPRAV